MKDVDPFIMNALEHQAREIGQIISEVIDAIDPGKRKQYGFALMLFSFDGPEFTYVSNAERTTMIKTMKEFIERNPPEKTWDKQTDEERGK